MTQPQCGQLESVWQRYLIGATGERILTGSTPSMFYCEEQILANMQNYESADFAGAKAEFRYAVKSCALASVLRCVAAAGWGADCQSVMEATLAMRAGVPASRISLCSPRLSLADLTWAFENAISINADSFSQLEFLSSILRDRQPSPGWKLGARVSLPVAGTARFHTKLGMELDTIYRSMKDLPLLQPHFKELHHHGAARQIGADLLAEVAASLTTSLELLEETLGLRIPYINLGGGLEPHSILQENGLSTHSVLRQVLSAIPPSVLSKDRTVVLEPGRAIVKDAAIAVTTVINLKKLRQKELAVVDLSTNLLIPLPLAQFVAYFPYEETESAKGSAKIYDIVDGTCSPAGVICRDSLLPTLSEGQRLVIRHTGAYTWSLAEPFYDWLPELWWLDRGGNILPILSRDQARSITDMIWGY